MHVRWRRRQEERGTDSSRPRRWGLPVRWRRWALLAAAVAAAVPLGSGAALDAMSSETDWNDLGRASGSSFSGELDFDELAIDEPYPDDVVKAGFAPDPEFFSDEEITGGLGGTGIPEIALAAYEDGADLTAIEDPECGVPWSVLAAIGRVESDHGRFGGAMLRADGYGTKPIRGVALNGEPGIALIRDTDRGDLDGDTVYDRAVGPMQFIPSTWDNVGVDGNGDDRRDPNNIFDAAWGAGVYLCAGDADLTEPGELARAVRRYNHTDEYVRVVLGLAEAYEAGDFEAAPGADPDTLGETGMDPGVYRDFEDVDPGPGGGFDDNGLFDPAPAPAPAPAPSPDPEPRPGPRSGPGPRTEPRPGPCPEPGSGPGARPRPRHARHHRPGPRRTGHHGARPRHHARHHGPRPRHHARHDSAGPWHHARHHGPRTGPRAGRRDHRARPRRRRRGRASRLGGLVADDARVRHRHGGGAGGLPAPARHPRSHGAGTLPGHGARAVVTRHAGARGATAPPERRRGREGWPARVR